MARVRFTLELLSPCRLEPYALLGLRQGLLRSAGKFPGEEADRLFTPTLSDDPQAVRRFQKPSAALVLRPPRLSRQQWSEGDSLELDVLFIGDGVQLIALFLEILREAGKKGLADGEGCFEVAAASCQTPAGSWRGLVLAHRGEELLPDVLSLATCLDGLLPLSSPVTLRVVSPARLLAAGRVLRRPRFSQLFPFMLRRVTSMLYYHCHLEPLDDPGALLSAAAQVGACWQDVEWCDWRDLGDGHPGSRVGGLIGQMRLEGEALEELGWIIALAAQFGIGRGAAFGSGQLQLFAETQSVGNGLAC